LIALFLGWFKFQRALYDFKYFTGTVLKNGPSEESRKVMKTQQGQCQRHYWLEQSHDDIQPPATSFE